MITRRRTAAVAGIGLGLALTLAGCTSTDTEEANDAWCTGHAAVESEVEAMEALIQSGSSGEEVRAQWNAVEAAIEANAVPLTQLSESVQEDVGAAYDAFTAAVEAIPEDAAPSEAAPQYSAAIDAFSTDMEAIQSEVGCS